MKKGQFKRIGSLLLALAMIVSIISGAIPTAVADSWPNDTASAEPTFAGYRVKDIENWDPDTDPYSDFLVASVPLQERNPDFAATQAKPYLTTDSQIMNMTGDYGNSFFGSTMYTNEFSEDVMTFWQYTDYFSPWHGAATAYTPQSLYDPATSDWQARGFEFGIVNIPNPAYTNAAHKNGVMSIACVYFDPAFRPGQTCEDLVGYDNWQEVAQQLIDMAEYYNFDGYFMNQEEGGWTNEFKQFMAYISASGLYTQWYDTNSTFNSSKAQWLSDDTYGKIHDSVFVNYSSFWNIDSQLAYAEEIGVDPYEAIFYGVEANQGGLAASHTSTSSLSNLFDENGNPRASYALFCASDHYFRGLESINSSADGDPRPTHHKDGYQWMGEERERLYWSGPTEDVTETGSRTGYSRSDVGADNVKWMGAAHFIAERSVINGTAFYSNFNTGHGMQYFVDGAVSKDEEWTNINIQEMMPTWQWWFESTDDTKVHADFDYGTALVDLNKDGTVRTMPFTRVGAWNGGNSLAVYGNLTGTDTMHLFKTDLDVNANSTVSVTFKKVSSDDAVMKLGLVFEDAPEVTETLALEGTDVAGEWTTSQVSLADYAGRQIAAIFLVFEGTSENYQINIGNITVTDGSKTPAAPEGFTLDKAYIDGQAIVRWELADYSEVIQYNLYGKQSDGSRVYLGGIYGNVLYVKNTFAEDTVELQLCAVGVDGSESEPATITYNYENEVSALSVAEAESETGLLVFAANPGQLDVSFAAPAAGAPDSYEFEVTLLNIESDNEDNQVYTATADGSATSVVIDLPVEEGYEYDLVVYAVNDGVRSTGISYRGASNDSYSEPLDPAHIEKSGSTIRLVDPDSVDWYKMTAYVDGAVAANFTRGAGARFTNKMTFSMSAANGIISVEVTDFAGNVSTPVTVSVVDGSIVDLDRDYGEETIPDPALREALQELVGPTLGDLVAYEGALDLSDLGITDLTGLTLLSGVTEIDLSGNDFTELYASMLPVSVKKVILDNCDALVLIDSENRSDFELVLGDLPALTTLHLAGYGDYDLDLSGCPELYSLYLTGTKMTQVDISANVKLHNFKIDNSQVAKLVAADASAYTDAYYWVWTGAKMDLSDNTDEGALLAGMADYFTAADLQPEIGVDPVVVVNDRVIDFYYPNVDNVIDLGKEWLLASLEMWTQSPDYYGYLAEFIVEISNDGTTYTQLAHITDGTPEYVVNVPEGTTARYIKIIDPNDTQAWSHWNVYGYDVAPVGFFYDNQRPVIVFDELDAPEVIHDGTVYNTLDLLENYFTSAKTEAGNAAADLLEAEWIDADYLAALIEEPSRIKVQIVDSQGNEYTYAGSGVSAGGYIIGELDSENPLSVVNIFASGEYTNEEAVMAFDDNTGTKWCTGPNGSWLTFETEEPTAVGAYTINNGNEGGHRKTKAWRLQVLNVDNVTEAEYMAMSQEDKTTVHSVEDNWITIDQVTDNTAVVSERTVAEENLTVAQVYRIIVDEREQQPDQQWAACRIYEVDLYGCAVTPAGDSLGDLDEENKLNVVNILASGYVNENESPAKLFDGNQGTKWCCDPAGSWVGFETEEAAYVGRAFAVHAGAAESSVYNTRGYRLQVLNTDVITEAEYLALDEVGKRAVMAAETNWVNIVEVTGNTETYVTSDIAVEEAVKAQVYRFIVDDRQSATQWPSCRVYELELYAYTVNEGGIDTNGLIKADVVEEYDVIFKSMGKEFARTTFSVVHDKINETTVAPTCTEDGYTSYGCSLCDEVVTTVLPATGHNYEVDVTVEPTCTEDGYTVYVCANCGDSYRDDYVDATGHSYEAVVTAPTCTEQGYTTYTCSVCGDSYVDDYVDATGHSYEAVVTAPTCTEKGYTTYTCSVCGDSYVDDYVDATGHSYEAVVTAPTCTEDGYTTYTCSVCGDTYVADYVDATGHNWSDPVIEWNEDETEATVTVTCECGATDTATITVETIEPTCTEDGKIIMTVIYQGEVVSVEEEVLPATGHDYEDGKCNNCGEKDPDYVEPTTSKPAGDNDSSDTGDGFHGLWLLSMGIALAGASVLVFGRKRFMK